MAGSWHSEDGYVMGCAHVRVGGTGVGMRGEGMGDGGCWQGQTMPGLTQSCDHVCITFVCHWVEHMHSVKEAIWLRNLLKSLSFVQSNMSRIHCDNIGLNILTHNPSFHARTKHIEIQHHYV